MCYRVRQDRALMLKPAFMNGISKLKQFGFTYDILIFPDQLKYTAEFVSRVSRSEICDRSYR